MTAEYVTATEAAQRLRIRTDEMGRLLRSGKLPGAFKADGVWKVPFVAIEARIEQIARRKSVRQVMKAAQQAAQTLGESHVDRSYTAR